MNHTNLKKTFKMLLFALLSFACFSLSSAMRTSAFSSKLSSTEASELEKSVKSASVSSKIYNVEYMTKLALKCENVSVSNNFCTSKDFIYILIPIYSEDTGYGLSLFCEDTAAGKIEFAGEKYSCIDDINLYTSVTDSSASSSRNFKSVFDPESFIIFNIDPYEEKAVPLFIPFDNKHSDTVIKSGKEYSYSELSELIKSRSDPSNDQNSSLYSSTNGSMVFMQKKNRLLNYIYLFLFIFSLVFSVVTFIRKIKSKKRKMIISLISVFAVIIFAGCFVYNYYLFGIKKIEYTLIKGNNTITRYTDLKARVKALDLDSYHKVKDSEAENYESINGSEGDVFTITFNSGHKKYYFYTDSYIAVSSDSNDKQTIYVRNNINTSASH